MSSNILKSIKELLIFYVKTHYENYIKEHNLTMIIDEKIHGVIKQIYEEKKEHSKVFIRDSLKTLYKEEYPGDKQINLLLLDIYEDDVILIKKMETQIIKYQNERKTK